MHKPIPRLAVINSFAGFGRISITAALPIISVMQVQACPLPTAVLSSHLAYSPCHKADLTEHMQDYFQAWEDIGLQFDGLCLGYVSDVRQLNIVDSLLECQNTYHLLKSDARIIIDPVMGDHGKAYSTVTPELISAMKRIVDKAHLVTPNLTEACMLTDTPWHPGIWSDMDLQVLCEKLDPVAKKQIVITGIHESDDFRNFLWDKGQITSLRVPSAGASRPGTGDIFTSILSANALKNKPFLISVQQAAEFISTCIRDSEEAGIPIKEGILFEQNLSRLL